MKFYFDSVNDLNLVPPALIVASYKSTDKISTSRLISEIRSISNIPESDKQILKDRSDDKFSQKVRNLISHKVLEKYNLATSFNNNIQLTKHGKKIGKLIKENFICDQINIKKITQDDQYQRSLLQARLNLTFDPIYLKKLNSCEFSQRAMGVFKNLNLTYVGDLVLNVSEDELKKTPKIGVKTIVEIKEFLKTNKLSLNNEIIKDDIIIKTKTKFDWYSIDKKYFHQIYLKHISKNFSNNNIDEIILSYLSKNDKENDLLFIRKEKIIKSRMSIDKEFSTLDSLGKEFKVERERIRQIQSKFCKHLINKENFKFAFNKLLKFLSNNTPIGEKYLNERLKAENFFNSYKSLSSLRTILSAFTKHKFETHLTTNNYSNLENKDLLSDEKKIEDEEFLVSSMNEIKELNKIISESRKLTTKYSFCNFNKVINDLFKTKKYTKYENIKNSLKKHSNFIWLDDENFMALDTSGQNIMKRLNKLLFIHKKISFEDFQAALLNDHRIRTSPPLNLIKKICKANNFESDNHFIYFKGKKPEIPNLEQKIINLFLENGKYITFWESIDLAAKYSINVGSLNAYMYGSYLIKRLDKVFVLAGTIIEDDKLNNAKQRASKESKDNDPNLKIDWADNKKINIKFKLTQSIISQGFIRYLPSHWHDILEGQYYNYESKSSIRINLGIWDLKDIISNFKKDTLICLKLSFNPNIIKVTIDEN